MNDTRILHVDAAERLIVGLALCYATPGPGVGWSVKTQFDWPTSVPVYWCHTYGGQLGVAVLENVPGVGVIAVAHVNADSWALVEIVSRQPNAVGFTVGLNNIAYVGKSAFVQRADIFELSLSSCAASFWHRDHDGQPSAFRASAVDSGPSVHSCPVLRGRSCTRLQEWGASRRKGSLI